MSENINEIRKINPIVISEPSAFGLYSPESVPNSVLESDSNFGQFDAFSSLNNNISKELENEVAKLLKIKIKNVKDRLSKAEKDIGAIGSVWSSIKNTKLLDKITDSTNDVKRTLEELEKADSEDIKKQFELATGCEFTKENVKKFIEGELKTKSEQAMDEFDEGQELAKDFSGDLLSGITSGITYTAIGGATVVGVATGAVTLAAAAPIVLGAAFVAALVGGATKVGVKVIESHSEKNEYKTGWKDLATGAINGALSPIAALGFGKVATSVVTKMGGSVAKVAGTTAVKAGGEVLEEVGEEVVEQTSKKGAKLLQNLSGNTYEGSNLVKAIGYSTEFAGQGAVVGATDAATRTAIDGGNSSDIANSALQGTAFGAAGGLVFGWGFKGLSQLGSKSASTGKVYNIEAPPTPKSTSGKLYSGLPIPELSKLLGKTSKAVTVDDVVEEYLKQRFLTLKYTLRDGSYEKVINSANGSQNPLLSLEISPRTFIEDVLFNENSIPELDAFAFYNFKRKFNMEDLKAGIEFMLDSYEPAPSSATTNVARNRQGQATQETGSASQSTASTGNDSSVASPKTTPKSSEDSKFIELLIQRGRKPPHEDKIITILKMLKIEDNADVYNEVAKFYNKFCGAKRKGNEEISKAFAKELEDLYNTNSTQNSEAYIALAKKYLADDFVLENPTPPSGNGTPAAGARGNDIAKTKLNTAAKLLLDDEMFSTASGYIDGTISEEEIAELAGIYIKNSIRSQKDFVPISKLKHSPEKILNMLTKMKGITGLAEVTDGQVAALGKTRSTQADIKILIRNFRIKFIESAIELTNGEDIPIEKLIKYYNKEYGWNLTKVEMRSISDYIGLKKQYADMFDIIKTKLNNAVSPDNINMDDIDIIRFIVDVLNEFPDFDFNKILQKNSPVNINNVANVYRQVPDEFKSEYLKFLSARGEKFDANVVSKWLGEANINSVLNFVDYLYLSSYGIPDEQLVSKSGSILDVLGLSERMDLKNFAFDTHILISKDKFPKIAERIDILFKVFGAKNLDELSDFFAKTGIKDFKIKSDLKDFRKFYFQIDFSGKELSIKDRLEVLAKIFENSNGRISKKEPFSQVINEHNVLQELAYKLSYDYADYENAIKCLCLNNEVEIEKLRKSLTGSFNKKTNNFNYITFRMLYDLDNPNRAKSFNNMMAELCNYLNCDDLDVLNGIHAKLRFFERFYEITDSPSEAFRIFEKAMNGTVKMFVYDEAGSFAPQCFINTTDDLSSSVCLTIDESLKIHTLYSVGWREDF